MVRLPQTSQRTTTPTIEKFQESRPEEVVDDQGAQEVHVVEEVEVEEALFDGWPLLGRY